MTGAATRDRYRRLANRIRAIPGQRFGLRPYTVAVLLKEYSGTYTGDGTETETETAIVEANGQPPKVRFLKDEERALADMPAGSVEVGPITPDFAGGGTAIATLKQSSAAAQDAVQWKLTGPEFPNGALFVAEGFKTDRALHYRVRLRPVASG